MSFVGNWGKSDREISGMHCISLVSNSSLQSVRPCASWWLYCYMMTSSNGNISALLAPCAGNSPVPVNSPHKGQWGRALMFSLICVWINSWVNSHEAGDLRRYRAHYDVIIMMKDCFHAGEVIMKYMIKSYRHHPTANTKREWCAYFVMMTTPNGTIFRVTGLCEGNPPVTNGFCVFFDVRLNKRLNRESRYWWFETPWLS